MASYPNRSTEAKAFERAFRASLAYGRDRSLKPEFDAALKVLATFDRTPLLRRAVNRMRGPR
jgi:hypothetical protein